MTHEAGFALRRVSLAAALWLILAGVGAASSGDPCVRLGSLQSRRCAAVCGTERRVALDGCQPLDPACLAPCRIARAGCGMDLQVHDVAQCTAEFAVAMAGCRAPETPADGFEACREEALAAVQQCRKSIAKEARLGGRACRRRFRACAAACAPASPADDVDPLRCRDSAIGAFVECGGDCADASAASAPVCHGDDPTCLQACADQHATCATPFFQPLKLAIVTCKLALKNAVAFCKYAESMATMRACRNDAEVAYDGCRGPAVVAAREPLAQCARGLDDCLGACAPSAP